MKEQQIETIPISEIRIVNPRSRNLTKWKLIVHSIATVGLKRPITVALIAGNESDERHFDLVCGQGRLEAFVELGESYIPAIIIAASEQDRQLMSLVENIARKPPSTRAILFEVKVLRRRAYTVEQIALKLGLDRKYLYGICNLIDKGEEYLVSAVEAGRIPLSVAIEITTGNNHEISRAL